VQIESKKRSFVMNEGVAAAAFFTPSPLNAGPLSSLLVDELNPVTDV
jgi:hypothetical protein